MYSNNTQLFSQTALSILNHLVCILSLLLQYLIFQHTTGNSHPLLCKLQSIVLVGLVAAASGSKTVSLVSLKTERVG